MNVFKSTDFQELFNLAYIGVIKQGGPSMSTSGRGAHLTVCAYTGKHGRKCGVGHCLTDESMSEVKSLEADVHDMMETLSDAGIELPDYGHKMLNFLAEMQNAHDEYSHLSETCHGGEESSPFETQFDIAMTKIAIHHGFSIPKV